MLDVAADEAHGPGAQCALRRVGGAALNECYSGERLLRQAIARGVLHEAAETLLAVLARPPVDVLEAPGDDGAVYYVAAGVAGWSLAEVLGDAAAAFIAPADGSRRYVYETATGQTSYEWPLEAYHAAVNDAVSQHFLWKDEPRLAPAKILAAVAAAFRREDWVAAADAEKIFAETTITTDLGIRAKAVVEAALEPKRRTIRALRALAFRGPRGDDGSSRCDIAADFRGGFGERGPAALGENLVELDEAASELGPADGSLAAACAAAHAARARIHALATGPLDELFSFRGDDAAARDGAHARLAEAAAAALSVGPVRCLDELAALDERCDAWELGRRRDVRFRILANSAAALRAASSARDALVYREAHAGRVDNCREHLGDASWRHRGAGAGVAAEAVAADDLLARALVEGDLGACEHALSRAAAVGLEESAPFAAARRTASELRKTAYAATRRGMADTAKGLAAATAPRICHDLDVLAPRSKRKVALSWAFRAARAAPDASGAVTTLTPRQRVVALRLWRHCVPALALADRTAAHVVVAINELFETAAPAFANPAISKQVREAMVIVAKRQTDLAKKRRAEAAAGDSSAPTKQRSLANGDDGPPPPRDEITAEASPDMVDEIFLQLAERLREKPPKPLAPEKIKRNAACEAEAKRLDVPVGPLLVQAREEELLERHPRRRRNLRFGETKPVSADLYRAGLRAP